MGSGGYYHETKKYACLGYPPGVIQIPLHQFFLAPIFQYNSFQTSNNHLSHSPAWESMCICTLDHFSFHTHNSNLFGLLAVVPTGKISFHHRPWGRMLSGTVTQQKSVFACVNIALTHLCTRTVTLPRSGGWKGPALPSPWDLINKLRDLC